MESVLPSHAQYYFSKGNHYRLTWKWIDYEHRQIKIPKTKDVDALTIPMLNCAVPGFFVPVELTQTGIKGAVYGTSEEASS
jgi:hypothetical protein